MKMLSRHMSLIRIFAFVAVLLFFALVFWRHASRVDETVHPTTFAIYSFPSTIKDETGKDTDAVQAPAPTLEQNVTFVVASRAIDDTSWLHNNFSRWHKRIYITDDSNAGLHVPADKGREGVVYLSWASPALLCFGFTCPSLITSKIHYRYLRQSPRSDGLSPCLALPVAQR